MSLIKISQDNFEQFTLETHPKVSFTSGSAGVTGSIRVFPRFSESEKEIQPLDAFSDSQFSDRDLRSVLEGVVRSSRSATDIESGLSSYMQGVNDQGSSIRKSHTLSPARIDPTFTLSRDFQKKAVIRDVLMPFYRSVYPSMNYGYTNYHCLNFFTASSVPDSSVIMYPAPSGTYKLPGAFTFDFYINPRYTSDDVHGDFRPGTLFHMSSSYAVSLVSGSSRDFDGFVDGFRLLLQLSHSAGVSPSRAGPGTFPSDLAFFSKDNSLQRNKWHHVAIRWGTNTVNSGTGSFVIDGKEMGTFVIPSSSVQSAGLQIPEVLSIGNFYEGPNSGLNLQSAFFNTVSSLNEGVDDLTGLSQDPAGSVFGHPLNAEVHDLKIYDSYRTATQISTSSQSGPENLDGLIFYVPPFFVKESPARTVLQTPFQSIRSTTDDPFNVSLSFGVGGRLVNTENFVREFVEGSYPRLFNLTASTIPGTTSVPLSANGFLYATGSIVKRNVTVLPCDNGLFVPNFDLLKTGSFTLFKVEGREIEKFSNDIGSTDLSMISLRDLIPTSSLRPGLAFESGSIFNEIVGSTPENPGVDPGEVLSIYQRTRDNSSNEVVFFDISDLFYGNGIDKKSLVLTDSAITGTDGKVSMTLRDDGFGNIYRADSKTEHATWNSIGNVFYNEGIALIKTPNIPFFGTDQFEMDLAGERNIHILRLNVVAPAGQINSSSNPAFTAVSSSLNANETDPDFVYITGMLFHDDNLNVIMKTDLAQPVVKRHGDRIMFKPRIDF